MGKAEEMAAALKLKSEKEAEATASLEAVIKEWPVRIEELLTDIEKWVSPLIGSGLSVTRTEETKSENPPGFNFRYTTHKLTIRHGSKIATVTPFARFMMGTGGRVDLKLGNTELGIILATDGTNTWKAMIPSNQRPPTRPQFLPFDEDFFLDQLAKFLEI
jgi:hypothetical protein